MDLRFPLACFGFSMALLAVGGCSPDDEHQQASLEAAQCSSSNRAWTASRISNSRMPWPTSAARCCCWNGRASSCRTSQSRPNTAPTTWHCSSTTPAARRWYRYLHQWLFVLRKASSSDYLTDLEPVFPFRSTVPDRVPVPPCPGMAVGDPEQQTSGALPAGVVRNRPGIQLSPSSANLSNPDDLTVTYPLYRRG
jgi:hypothetical protein